MEIIRNDGARTYRLSSQQCGLHGPQAAGAGAIHVVLLEGPAQGAAALREALECRVAHHEILRMRYRAVAGLRYPLQDVLPALPPTWTTLDGPVGDEALMAAARSAVDAREGAVLGAALAVSADGRAKWALAAPALSLDAEALQALALACAASGTELLDDGALQYPDYVGWQCELLASELGQQGARFWAAQATAPASRLPFGGARAGAAVEYLRLAEGTTLALAELAERLGMPTASVLAGLWAAFLARIAATGTPTFHWHVDGRSEELAGALGCFAAGLPVSLRLDPQAPAEALLRAVDAELQAAASWQECFDAAALLDGQAGGGRPQGGIGFAYLRLRGTPGGWACTRIERDPAGAALLCECLDADGRLTLRWSSAGACSAQALRTWARQFATLLASAAGQPELAWPRWDLLGADERVEILQAAVVGLRAGDAPAATLHGLFETQAARRPEAPALVCGEERLSYGALAKRADRLANRLRRRGIGEEQVVGIHLGRSVHVVAAMLAVLKAGAAYVPLDPAYPAQRISAMLEDAQVRAVIAEAHDRPLLGGLRLDCICVDDEEEDGPDEDGEGNAVLPGAHVHPGSLAYLIYTSGSTGRPKGVMVSHANAVASTAARFAFYAEPVSRFLLLSSPSFDSSVAGIFWTLGQGGALHLPTEALFQDPVQIAALMAREGISHVLALPSFHRQILDHLEDPSRLRCAIVAGEACVAEVVQQHRRRAPGAALVNEYGPTEGTVWSNAFLIEGLPAEGERIPIGRPIPSMKGHVLDERLALCPIGVAGEWYIGGTGITRGYRGQPGLTAQRFVADPFEPCGRLYRTGDRVRLRPDGELEYLGRIDNQVKLRGHRIELDEIEQNLLAHKDVREAVVLLQDDPGPRLVACVVTAAAAQGSEEFALREALGAHLRARLPAFMVPARFVLLPRLPAMPNGKVDRRALLALADAGTRARHVAPVTEVERALAEIWQAVLKVERVGLEDSFFELGGHSLLATQVSARIRQQLAVELPLRDLLDAGNLAELAARVQRLADTAGDEAAKMEALLSDAEAGA
ncbi:non-ribosomal peptide synthetase [Variovorax sp. DT-64]|uniref:non-ribosomal peptide synthetase n=1 Tax=Variovorax sp. DT-64 TaxID=3396160 RepID=UPI003F1D267A